jgi:hypothetical protein
MEQGDMANSSNDNNAVPSEKRPKFREYSRWGAGRKEVSIKAM